MQTGIMPVSPVSGAWLHLSSWLAGGFVPALTQSDHWLGKCLRESDHDRVGRGGRRGSESWAAAGPPLHVGRVAMLWALLPSSQLLNPPLQAGEARAPSLNKIKRNTL